jgi:hypothetical protein
MTLSDTPQWILVKLIWEEAKQKFNKIPCNYITRQACNAHEGHNWTTRAAAQAVANAAGQGWTIGFVITATDDWFCVDIDSCKQAAGQWSPLANEMAAALPGCFIETSLSGNGLHIWGRYASPPPHASKRIDLNAECYTTARFIAIGTPLQGTVTDRCDAFPAFIERYFPPRAPAAGAVADHGDGPRSEWRGPADDDELLRRAMRSQSAAATFGMRASFADLWNRNVEVLSRSYPGDGDDGIDASSADAALAAHLAFWAGCDADRIDRLMRRSGLVRDKYEREDYLPRTIGQACARQGDVLQDKPVVPPAMAVSPSTAPVPPPPPGAPPAPAEMAPREGDGFLNPTQQAELFQGCYYVADQHRVLCRRGKLYPPERFNAVYGGHVFALDKPNSKTTRKAFEAFTESQVMQCPMVDGTCFRPDLPYGAIVTTEGRSRANMFWPAQVYVAAGDLTPWFRHLELLLPSESDRRILVYFLANCVQRPGFKAQWMPLLVGVEGNGKSIISRALAYAVGEIYTHWADASKLGEKFNAWMFGRLLVCIEDLKIGDNAEVWEKLKPMITGERLEIEGKGIDQRTDEVCANFIANSNHKNAIRATLNDRRVCHLWTAQQSEPDLIATGITQEHMSAMYDWAKNGGFAAVAHFLQTVEIPPEYGLKWFQGRAPRASVFDQAVAAGRGAVEQEIMEAVEQELPGFCGGWVSSGALDRLLDRIGKARAVAPNKRREILQGLGYDWHPALRPTQGRVNNAVLPDGVKVKLFVRTDSPAAKIATPAAAAAAYSAAQGIQAAGR